MPGIDFSRERYGERETSRWSPSGRLLLADAVGFGAEPEGEKEAITTIRTLTCMDLLTEKVLWEKPYEGGCDRLALSPDGKVIYLPSLEQAHWHVIDALSGDIIKKLEPGSGAHNTIYGLDGKHAYLAGLKSPILRVTETASHTVTSEVGPFGNVIRPFTVNGSATRCFVNVNELLGFEVGSPIDRVSTDVLDVLGRGGALGAHEVPHRDRGEAALPA